MITWWKKRRALRQMFAAHRSDINSVPLPEWTAAEIQALAVTS